MNNYDFKIKITVLDGFDNEEVHYACLEEQEEVDRLKSILSEMKKHSYKQNFPMYANATEKVVDMYDAISDDDEDFMLMLIDGEDEFHSISEVECNGEILYKK
jgi:molybdopterin converting factor small subunit